MTDTKTAAKQVQLQIQLDEATAQGMYINLALVNNTETEFTIDAMYVQPQQPKAQVRARLITSPKHAKRLMMVLQENIRRYEEAFGPLDVSGPHISDQLLQ